MTSIQFSEKKYFGLNYVGMNITQICLSWKKKKKKEKKKKKPCMLHCVTIKMCHHLYLTDVENIHYKLNFPHTTIPKCKLQNLYSKTPWLIDWYNCHLAFLQTCFQHIIYFSITLSLSHWFSSIHLSCRWSLLVNLWSNTFLECFILMDRCNFKNDILDVISVILSSQPVSELR